MTAATAAFALSLSACCRPGAAERPYTPAELAAEERAQLARAGAGYSSAAVPPFIVIDFPDAPVWLNEGLASLFEQPSCRAEPGSEWERYVAALR